MSYYKRVRKVEATAHRAARSREPEKERQEKEQVYIWPLFPSSFPLRKHILLLADCSGQCVCCTRERGLERTPPGLQTKEYTTVTSNRRLLDILSHKHTDTQTHTHTSSDHEGRGRLLRTCCTRELMSRGTTSCNSPPRINSDL